MTTRGGNGRHRWEAGSTLTGAFWTCTCGEGSGEDYPSEAVAALAAEEHVQNDATAQ